MVYCRRLPYLDLKRASKALFFEKYFKKRYNYIVSIYFLKFVV